ncbi:Sec63 Brl domain-containing protein, partial [Blyttiomyces helicus]
SGTEIIESGLHENLIEHLNAESVLGTITSVDNAIEWLKRSFLYVRIQKNPSHYKLKNCSNQDAKLSAEHRLEAICVKDLELLNKFGFINLHPQLRTIKSNANGSAMAKYYIKFKTAAALVQLKPHASLKDMLDVLCKSEEFADIGFRQDKAVLTVLNKNPAIRFPIKGRLSTADLKVNLLIQCTLGSIPFTEPKTMQSMMLEANSVLPHACRISRCLIDIAAEKQDLVMLRNALDLARCLEAKTWETSPLLLKQIDSIGPSLAKLLAAAGISSFRKLESIHPSQIEAALSRNPPFGKKVLELAATIPRPKISVTQAKDNTDPTRVDLFFDLRLENPATAKTSAKRRSLSAFLVVGTSDNVFIDFQQIPIFKLKDGVSIRLKVKLANAQQKIVCSLIHDGCVGLDASTIISPDINPVHFRNLPRNSSAGAIKPAAQKVDGVKKRGDSQYTVVILRNRPTY